MADIIRPVFGGRKPEMNTPCSDSEPPTEETDDEEDAKLLAADVTFCMTHLENIREARRCGDLMTNYIFDELPRFFLKDESLDLRRGVIAQLSLENLCEHLTTSTRTDWAEKPHFYGAVFVEYDARCIAIHEAWSELEEGKSPEGEK